MVGSHQASNLPIRHRVCELSVPMSYHTDHRPTICSSKKWQAHPRLHAVCQFTRGTVNVTAQSWIWCRKCYVTKKSNDKKKSSLPSIRTCVLTCSFHSKYLVFNSNPSACPAVKRWHAVKPIRKDWALQGTAPNWQGQWWRGNVTFEFIFFH